MLICLMRHGQTAWNARRRMQGRSDVPLSPEGLEQVRRAADRLEHAPYDRIFASPLLRARQTAQAAAARWGGTVEIEPLLIEMGFGDMEGAAYEAFPREFFTDPERYAPPPGGESFEALDLRCAELLERRLPAWEAECESVLLCSHGATINAVVRRVLGRPLRDFWAERQSNCSRVFLTCENGTVRFLEKKEDL